MLEAFPSFLLLALGFYGWGGVFSLPRAAAGTLAEIGWSGLLSFSIAFVVGAICHFWLPLKYVATAFVAVGVVVGVCRLPRGLGPRRWAWLGFLFLLCLLFSARVLNHGDTGSYHLQAVQWITEEPAVFGLANLHGRFGFNSAWWVIAGMMQLPWMPSAGCLYMATGLLAFFFGLLVLEGLLRLWAGKAEAADIIFSCSAYLWFRQVSGINNPSLGTDAPANLLGVAAAVCLATAFFDRSLRWAGVGAVLATLALTVKLSAAIWLPGSMLAIMLVYRVGLGSRTERLAEIGRAGAFAVAVGGLWVARGYVCSGFPAYPSRLLGALSLPWTVPAAKIARDTAGVRDWPTRGGSSTDSLADTLWRWVENQYGLTNMVFALVATLAGLAGLLFLIRAVRKSGWGAVVRKISPLFTPAGTALAGLIFCFVTAPAMRFASGYFFALAGLSAVAIFILFPVVQGWSRSLALIAVISAVALNASGAMARSPSLLALPAFPAPQVQEKVTSQGIAIQVPLRGAMAWNVRRPSTPYFDPEIRFEFSRSGSVTMIKNGDRVTTLKNTGISNQN